MKSPSILLLQARDPDDPMKLEELYSFSEKCRLAPESFSPYDLLAGPPPKELVRRHDAVMIGGSGDYYVSNRSLPHFDAQLECLVWIAETSRPLFASCFGHQILVAALGGEIVNDPENTEVGTYELQLTPEGEADPLLGTLPSRFHAQMGRKDRATTVPEGAQNLASSKRCGIQALRLTGKPVWSTQFHPELDEGTNRERYLRYIDGYSLHMSAAEREASWERFSPSPHTEGLLAAFLGLVFG